jgi:hypothetical protein
VAKIKRPRRVPRWIELLTSLTLAIAAIATLSYGTGAHIVMRYLNPPFGAWWNANEFGFAQFGAAGFGMLVGIRIGARLVSGETLKRRSIAAAVIAGAVAIPVVARTVAEVARYKWSSDAMPHSWLIAHLGYDLGMILDKLLAAGVYSIKIALFALPLGMILFALAIVFFMNVEPVRVSAQSNSK